MAGRPGPAVLAGLVARAAERARQGMAVQVRRAEVGPVDWSALEAAARQAVAAAAGVEDLDAVRVRFLGRRGEVTQALRRLGELPPAERPAAGQQANAVRASIEALLADRRQALDGAATEARLAAETADVTLPGRWPPRGHLHPLSLVQADIERVFASIGFAVAEGPEVETDWYNFEALNIPVGHPAREMQDSFYIETPRGQAAAGDPAASARAPSAPAASPPAASDLLGPTGGQVLLRPHTSPVQIRYMRSFAPRLPVRIIAPGRVYRRDDDATHSPMFHQVEGLLVDRGVSLAHLKGVLAEFAQRLFGAGTRIRFRPSYFPFTEPSAEVDVSCTLCGGAGCRTCKGSGWLEVLGSGMVHPQVLRNGGYDPEVVSGFAFGMGIERVAMLRYGIDDLRHFFQNDLRFLEQF